MELPCPASSPRLVPILLELVVDVLLAQAESARGLGLVASATLQILQHRQPLQFAQRHPEERREFPAANRLTAYRGRLRHRQRRMPAVILSAASDSEARIKRLGPNAPLLLQKPIRRETMLSAIRTVLEKSGQQI